MARRHRDAVPDDEARDSIGALIRDIRKRREMTLEQLSELTGISVSSLSRIENTRLGMTIEKVEMLARALDVSPQVLVSRNRQSVDRRSAQARAARFIVDRARERKTSFDRELRIEYLFERDADRLLDCLHVTVQSISIWDSEFVRHPGEKIIYVIGGAAMVYCQKQSPVVLERGDSLYLDANVWHSVVAANDAPAEMLVTYHNAPGADRPFDTRTFTPNEWIALQPS